MPHPIHDRTASVVSLARTILQGVDPNQAETKIVTAQLVLVLQTLIDMADPLHHQKVRDGATRTVQGMMAELAKEAQRGA